MPLRPASLARTAFVLLAAASGARPLQAQASRPGFTNLKVLPQGIAPEKLRAVMSQFTRALGVRCDYCHVDKEGGPGQRGQFALDDKPTKLAARKMMLMVQEINEHQLAGLASRSTPPVQVECMTCHRGIPQPRSLGDDLKLVYDAQGLKPALDRYHALRDKYYGRSAYDFGEVALADLAAKVRAAGHPEDALQLLALNVEMNPASRFAKAQHAAAVVGQAFGSPVKDAGPAAYRELKSRYGAAVVSENLLNQIGYELMGAGRLEAAISALGLAAAEYPASANAFDSLGEAYLKHGEVDRAKECYTKSLQLDPKNTNAQEMVNKLKEGAKPK
ncbi:MAG TPA: c-type cytochrome [Holophagaceae bacterium]|nr:c-type cytochrome [Holophagaceae bacterium]